MYAVCFTARAMVGMATVAVTLDIRDSLKKQIIIPASLQMKDCLAGGHFHNEAVRNPSAPVPG